MLLKNTKKPHRQPEKHKVTKNHIIQIETTKNHTSHSGNMILSAASNLEAVFTICIGRFYALKAWIQGKKRSKVEHLASIFNAVAAFLGH